MSFILFPTQLFELQYIPNEYREYKFYLIEHDKFYGMVDKMNFNKKKIILHKASCLAYVDNIKEKINIKYTSSYPIIKNSKIVIFDVVDNYIENDVIKFYKKLKTNVNILETPNFMSNRTELDIFYNKNQKKTRVIHSSFYKYQLKLHKIPYIKKSYDVENRKYIPDKEKLPNMPKENSNKYIKEAIEFTETNFKTNYGDSNCFYLPVTHKEAKKWFNVFLKNKAKKFAEYQDAIVPEEPFLFHSVISSAMNIGLLNPIYVIDKVINAYKDKKMDIKDYEAFIRQIIGWREYQRLIYIYFTDDIISKNYFNNNNKLTKDWYNGTLGIPPVDDAIRMAFKYGYLHHILRLMVMCNFMNLCNINPYEVYKWFMEFSTDSYEWVMIGNVYSMGMWSDGGITMRKPYISSGNYIQTMAHNRYENGNWESIWKALFYNFYQKIEKN